MTHIVQAYCKKGNLVAFAFSNTDYRIILFQTFFHYNLQSAIIVKFYSLRKKLAPKFMFVKGVTNFAFHDEANTD